MTTLRVPLGPEDHVRGSPNARVTLVEYGDYQCPHCAAAQPVVGRLEALFGNGLRVAFRHFPLSEMHPLAEPAAETAEFAAASGAFWTMHEALFANQPLLSMRLLTRLSQQLNLSEHELHAALASALYRPKVKAHFLGGVRSGVNGTPTFFVDGVRFDLPPTFETLGPVIQSRIAEQE
jgi:protein-disulfide isomerase